MEMMSSNNDRSFANIFTCMHIGLAKRLNCSSLAYTVTPDTFIGVWKLFLPDEMIWLHSCLSKCLRKTRFLSNELCIGHYLLCRFAWTILQTIRRNWANWLIWWTFTTYLNCSLKKIIGALDFKTASVLKIIEAVEIPPFGRFHIATVHPHLFLQTLQPPAPRCAPCVELMCYSKTWLLYRNLMETYLCRR